LIESEDLTNSDKSFETDGEPKLNAGCEALAYTVVLIVDLVYYL